MTTNTCSICIDGSIGPLKIHLKKIHNLSIKDYWTVHVLGEELEYTPLCEWKKCSNEVVFVESKRFFRKYCSNKCKGLAELQKPHRIAAVSNTFKRLWRTKEFSEMVTNRGKERFVQQNSDPEFIENKLKGFRNLCKDPLHIAKLSARLTARNKTPEARAISRRNINRLLNTPEFWEKMGPKFSKRGYYISTKTGRNMFYRSSYELRAMEILDADSSVTDYFHEPLTLRYKLENKEHRYYPDFMVYYSNKIYLIEVKPTGLLDLDINKAKFEAAERYCKENNMKFSIWTQSELGL